MPKREKILARAWNGYGSGHRPKRLSEIIQVSITPRIKLDIAEYIANGKFPNVSEFIRFLIVRYLDEMETNKRYEEERDK